MGVFFLFHSEKNFFHCRLMNLNSNRNGNFVEFLCPKCFFPLRNSIDWLIDWYFLRMSFQLHLWFSGWVHAVCFHPDGDLIAVATISGIYFAVFIACSVFIALFFKMLLDVRHRGIFRLFSRRNSLFAKVAGLCWTHWPRRWSVLKPSMGTRRIFSLQSNTLQVRLHTIFCCIGSQSINQSINPSR